MKNLFVGALLLMLSTPALARDQISIVGSSTVYPFSTAVAERFGKTTEFKSPIVESTGSGGGFKLFCKGIGIKTPDITNASRAIKQSEIDTCAANGVNAIVEIKVGYDGIVIANDIDGHQYDLSLRDLFLALAKQVPNPDGSETLVDNPYMMWNEINPSFPAIKIEVMGPPPTSGTRDAFVELAMEGGAKKFDWLKALRSSDKSAFKNVAHTIREDGAFIESGENDNLIVQKLSANPSAIGIFGYSFLEQNSDMVKGSTVEGIEPTFEAISDGSYPVSRPLFVYAKKEHIGVFPGIQEFLLEFTDERASGEEGYLTDKGLIPAPDQERQVMRNRALNLEIIE